MRRYVPSRPRWRQCLRAIEREVDVPIDARHPSPWNGLLEAGAALSLHELSMRMLDAAQLPSRDECFLTV